METFISIMVSFFTFSMIINVELFMYRRPPSQKQIDDYQKRLDEVDANAKNQYNFDWKHDSLIEIMKDRKLQKSWVLIFSGFFLVLIFIGLIFISTLSYANLFLIIGSAILLICYGLYRMAESKILAMGLLAFVFTFGILANIIFNKLMVLSPYSYFYLCAMIAVIGIFIAGRNSVKKIV